MTEKIEKVEKVNEKDNMVLFGYNLSLINLLFFILIIVLSLVMADDEESILSTILSIMILIHIMSNVLTFAFGIVGLFGSSRKGRALTSLCLSIITFFIYIALVIIYMSDFAA